MKKGDAVEVGQLVADSDSPVSAPIHSGVSGTVAGTTELLLPGGRTAQALIIESDGEQRVHESVRPPVIDTFEEFITAVRGVRGRGAGRRGLPTHVKLNPQNRDAIDTIIINAAECEPYITADYRECMENSWDVVSGVQTVMEFLDASRVIIAIEGNKPAAIAELSKIAKSVSTPLRRVECAACPPGIPPGGRKRCSSPPVRGGGECLPAGFLRCGLYRDECHHLRLLSRDFKTGMPLISRRLTVDGPPWPIPRTCASPSAPRSKRCWLSPAGSQASGGTADHGRPDDGAFPDGRGAAGAQAE